MNKVLLDYQSKRNSSLCCASRTYIELFLTPFCAAFIALKTFGHSDYLQLFLFPHCAPPTNGWFPIYGSNQNALGFFSSTCASFSWLGLVQPPISQEPYFVTFGHSCRRFGIFSRALCADSSRTSHLNFFNSFRQLFLRRVHIQKHSRAT